MGTGWCCTAILDASIHSHIQHYFTRVVLPYRVRVGGALSPLRQQGTTLEAYVTRVVLLSTRVSRKQYQPRTLGVVLQDQQEAIVAVPYGYWVVLHCNLRCIDSQPYTALLH